ncbi:BCS1 N terminal-domain-containing protein [Bombardia bombarda]|uniref:BCS1 N terminal-domain-containing protein n=1 Tax=Bombardia bombarda TaxID=252184 RepID=A0AA39X6N1_9PEZI|nr:BCS1 N terminal-domain-containing protein [Bombardia bombarda]
MAMYNGTDSPPVQPSPSHQISIVDVIFPGLAGVPAIAEQLLAGNLNRYTHLLWACGMLVFFGRHAYMYLVELAGLVGTYFTSTVHVRYSNEAYDMLVTWISSQPFADKARSTLASVGLKRMVHVERSDWSRKKPLYYSPWNGHFFFQYKNHLLKLRCEEKEVRFSVHEEISLSCLGRSSTILRELLSECRTEYLKLVQNKTSVFEHRDRGWKRTSTRDIRPMSTVIMDEKEKGSLVEDINSFLDPGARAWYSNRAIPYRRGYLLYGPPGTGKSSLSLSIAGCFRLDIYVLSLSDLREDSLNSLFAELPQHCVILLEDIDAVSSTRSRDAEEEESDKVGKVSLSALLNVLDGVASQEGRVLIMTTNHIEKLDAALVRPGRVDKKVEFRLADMDMIIRLFNIVYKRLDKDVPQEGKRIEDDVTVERLANRFAAEVPKLEFSPAEILSFLLENKQSAAMALDHAQEWMTRTREERKKVKRADSWVHQE